MLAVPLLLAVIAWYLVLCLKWKKNIFDVMEKLPGLKWHPIFGTYSVYGKASRADVLYKFAEVSTKYMPIYRSWRGRSPDVHLLTADHLQILLRSSTHTSKGPFYDYLFPWLGDGVLLSNGAKWFFQRKLLTNMFHFKMLESFVQTFGEKINLLNDIVASKANGDYFDIRPHLHVSTLSAICETSMGVPLETITDNPMEYIQDVQDITEIAMWRFWRPWIKNILFYLLPQGRQYNRVLKNLHAFSAKVVACRKKLLLNNQKAITDVTPDKKKRLSFMDLILEETENRQTINDTDLKALVDTFLFAGFETTGNSLGWALFLLGNHPDVQEKAFKEVRGVLKDKPAPTSIAEVNEMRYVDCIVRETLRLFPVLAFITRKTTIPIELDGYKIPPGTQAFAHIFLVHRNPEHFPDPEKFDPERFTPENSKTRHPFAYIPFSAGPRNCLGMRFALTELRTAIATILNRYKVTSLHTEEEQKIFAHIFVKPQLGFHVKLETRD